MKFVLHASVWCFESRILRRPCAVPTCLSLQAALAALYPDRVQSLVQIAPLGPTWGKQKKLLEGMEGADKLQASMPRGWACTRGRHASADARSDPFDLQFSSVNWNLGIVWGL